MADKRFVMLYKVKADGAPRMTELEVVEGPKTYSVVGGLENTSIRTRIDKVTLYHWGKWSLTPEEAWANFRRELEKNIVGAEAQIEHDKWLLGQCPAVKPTLCPDCGMPADHAPFERPDFCQNPSRVQ